MATITYTFRATVLIKVEASMKSEARMEAEAIADEIRAKLPTGAVMGGSIR